MLTFDDMMDTFTCFTSIYFSFRVSFINNKVYLMSRLLSGCLFRGPQKAGMLCSKADIVWQEQLYSRVPSP